MKFDTRQATPDDRDQLYELYASVLKGHITMIWGWNESWQQSDFDTHFIPEQITVSIIDGNIIGYIHIEENGTATHVRMMCIRPEYQRKGIGATLLKALIQNCLTKQQTVGLGVFRINTDARRFYQRLGFELCGETETHYEMKWKA